MSDIKLVLDPAVIEELLYGEDGPVAKHIMRLAIKTQSQAKVLCPVDTGRLRSSIIATMQREPKGIVGYVGTDVTYAEYQEFGTRFMAAQPFLRPALDTVLGAD